MSIDSIATSKQDMKNENNNGEDSVPAFKHAQTRNHRKFQNERESDDKIVRRLEVRPSTDPLSIASLMSSSLARILCSSRRMFLLVVNGTSGRTIR